MLVAICEAQEFTVRRPYLTFRQFDTIQPFAEYIEAWTPILYPRRSPVAPGR